MRRVSVALAFVAFSCGFTAANALECRGNKDAIGTSRVMAVDPAEHARVGKLQYPDTLPLADKEIVLTFDDGPQPPYTTKVLDILRAECVKATFFIVGNMARAHPEMVRRIYAEGHTVGTHTQTHPMTFDQMPSEGAQAEIEQGIASVTTALGNAKAVAPFFRIPGLPQAEGVEKLLRSRGLMSWGADLDAEDWKRIPADEIVQVFISRIEAGGKGILLLHDIQPATALALPQLLKELKSRGYRIVHVIPKVTEQPKNSSALWKWIFAR